MNSLIKVIAFVLVGSSLYAQSDIYLKSAESLIEDISKGLPYQEHLDLLSNATVESIETELNTDAKKYAFWMNIYNAFIQIELRNDHSLYDKRNKFFNREVIHVGGEQLRFSAVKPGIIRRS